MTRLYAKNKTARIEKYLRNVWRIFVEYRKTSTSDGFSLIELMMVLGIISLLIAIGIGAYLEWGRISSIKASALVVKSGLNTAREWAVSQNRPAYLSCSNAGTPLRGIYTISVNGELIGHTNFLSEGIIFSTDSVTLIRFNVDGTCDSAGYETNDTFDIILLETGRPILSAQMMTVRISRISGYSRILQ
jgi:prepilin-type N-terminal cleavage/methylation domain-containing protein